MIDRIIHFSIHNKIVVFIGLIGLILWGIYSLQNLPIDAVPDITDNQVQVITTSPNLSTQEVERKVTYPIELELGNIPEVEEIRSISRIGLSVITIVFKENVDIYWARELINQKLQIAKEEIPEGYGNPEMGPISTGLGEIYQYVLYPDEGYEDQYDGYDLRTIQDWIVKRQLTGIPGVVEINSSGGYLKQYEIQINSEQMRGNNVTLEDLLEAIEKNNENIGGAYVETQNHAYFIRGEGILSHVEDIGNIVVKVTEGVPVLVKNIAEINIGHAIRYGAVTMVGKGEVVAGQVMMLKGENSQATTERIKERIEEIKTSLPEGVILEPYLDRSALVKRTTYTVSKNLIEGALIVIFILVLLLGNLRAGLIVASVIPLSMLFAVSMMRIFGVSANLMSLGALDFGLVVDGSVIIVESILFHLGIANQKRNLTFAQKDNEIYISTTTIIKSAAFGYLIIMIVYIPILLLQGIEGKMFRPMAQTVSFAILGALLLSLTYVPMMASLSLKNIKDNPRALGHRTMDKLKSWYMPLLDFSLKYKYGVLIATVLLFTISIWQANRMGGEFIPTLEEGDFALHQILPTGSSLQKGIEVSGELQKILKDNFPEVKTVVTKIGTAEIPTDIMPLEAGDIFVIMKPKSEWTSASTKEEMFEKMNQKLREFPGVMYEFTQPIQMRFNELMTGVRQDIAIKIYGEDLGLLNDLASRARSIIATIDGVGDIQMEATEGLKSMVVEYDRVKLAKYGLNVKNINNVLASAYAGNHVGQIYEGDRSFDLVVRLPREDREDLEKLFRLAVPLPESGFIPLSEVATIEYQSGPAQISRDDTKRRITLGINTRNRDINSVISDIELRFAEELNLPAGYRVKFGGQFENFQRARDRLLLIVPMALALIFLLLFFTFNSVTYALLIYTAIPLSSIGGIWALHLRDMPLSISAGVGFIALFGVAVLNGIVLIGYFNQLKKEGMTNTLSIIRKGAGVRLRPVIMTALVASLGFLPMALSHSAGAEVQRPLATVVIGGLISATFLTLIILPILYALVNRMKLKGSKTINVVIFLIICGTGSLSAQNPTRSLTDGLQALETNQTLITSRDARVSSIDALMESPVMSTPWTFSYGSEEWNGTANQGIHQIQVMKNFRLNKLVNVQKQNYAVDQRIINNQFLQNQQNLKSQYVTDYINAAFYRSMEQLHIAILDDYNQRLNDQNKRLELGIVGLHHVLPYEIQVKRINNEIIRWSDQYDLALVVLSKYDQGSNYNVNLLEDIPQINVQDVNRYPQLEFFDLAAEKASVNFDLIKARRTPQIVTGLSLQSVNGSAPFYGLTLGTQVYLDKNYLSASNKNVRFQQEAFNAQKILMNATLDRTYDRIRNNLKKSKTKLDFLRNEQLAEIQQYIDLLDQAYRQGEANISDLLIGQQMYNDNQIDYLETLKDYLIALYQIKIYE